MNIVKCPVEGCPGYETTSGRPGLKNHIKKRASSELLDYYLGVVNLVPHAEYIKNNITKKDITTFSLKIIKANQ